MKIFQTLLMSILFISCGAGKKVATETPKEEPVVIVTPEITTPTPPEVETPVVMETPKEVISTPPKVELASEKFNHAIFDMLLEENVTDDGRTNYQGFINKRSTFKLYLTALANKQPNDSWSKEDKLAYWMNTYNAFTIKLIIDNYPTNSIKDIKDPWDARFFKLGTKWYNLNEIEHKILRKMNDPRIHFGINCASFSCPPLLNGAFTAATVDSKLDFLAHQFINDPLRNKITENRMELSKIFQWFAKDFKTEGSLLEYLNKYSEVTIKSNAKKSFLKYNWNLNK